MLAHAVYKDIRTAVCQHGGHDFICPIIVVGKTAKRCLQTADNNWCVVIGFSYHFTVYREGTVGSAAAFSSGRIGIVGALSLGCGIIGHHGIYISRRDEKTEARAAKAAKILAAFIIRLRKNGNTVALSFKNVGDDRRAERRVVYISVTRYVNEVDLPPAARLHIGALYGEKTVSVG